MRVNKLRVRLARPGPMFGMAFYSQSLAIMEIIGHSGFDFVFIDCEHSPLAIDSQLENVLRAADYAGLATVVRVKGNDEHMIRNALEFGADAVCIPHVRRAADAEQAVSFAKFPPWGVRGAAGDVRVAHYGAGAFDWKAYVEQSNRDSLIVPLAEDREFFDNIDEILAVKGIDMVNIGPLDLAMSLGLGGLVRTDVPEVQTRFDLLLRKSAEKGIHVLCPALPPTLEQARKLAEAGAKAILLRNDLFCVRTICKQFVDDIVGPIRGSGPATS
ncbi:MAG: aldolase/citrate lyase family protein [Burkholderiales bacterium]